MKEKKKKKGKGKKEKKGVIQTGQWCCAKNGLRKKFTTGHIPLSMSYFTFIPRHSFQTTMPLAHGLDSLVRVTRRVEHDLTLCCQASRVHTITNRSCVFWMYSQRFTKPLNSNLPSARPPHKWNDRTKEKPAFEELSHRDTPKERGKPPMHLKKKCFFLNPGHSIGTARVRRKEQNPSLSASKVLSCAGLDWCWRACYAACEMAPCAFHESRRLTAHEMVSPTARPNDDPVENHID